MTFDTIVNLIREYTLLDDERLLSLWGLVKLIKSKGIKGDIVECGCSRGGSSALLCAAKGKERKLWIYDSFLGMPKTSEHDCVEAKKFIGSCRASVTDVLNIMKLTGIARDEYIIVEGMFHDTFKNSLPARVALLHCDADWYTSVTEVLDTFYPLIPEGGCIILDDFGYWEGCRTAFYDFCARHREQPLLERVGITQAFWIKGKQHNRNA